MGWLKDLWTRASGQTAEDLTLLSNLTIKDAAYLGQDIRPDQCYIELYIESLRLEKARRFATRFHGVVYAFQQLARQGEGNADLAALSKPEKLAQLDQNSIGQVITVSRKLTGPIPWRGGSLHLELGLFSVKSGNVLTPLLDFVTDVSKTAGVSFLGAAAPFVPLVTKGLDVLAGQNQDVAAEVAIDTDLTPEKSAVFAIVNAPKGRFKPEQISIDPTDKKLLKDGKPLEHAYCVFSIRQTREKADYGEIPELKQKYADLIAAIRSGKREDANAALTAFRLTAVTSADLIPADADALVLKAKDQVSRAFAEGVAKSAAAGPVSRLEDIGLYARQ